ncbi:phosphoenolpyruvate-protein phosphotransferase [Collibacillus ludicampi]|uniref:Phosphoenolpyruvate-protein phosphotransferase n=2 Tax=Collibacillus ludicampi TaxID=2771369 RepID=A0AAV4LAQ7_9BACL|nr:phosphoenolpyruvate-protein phosphotransferase [Collibacillus ludicampi]
MFTGIAASRGIAIGPAFILQEFSPVVTRVTLSPEDSEKELDRLNQAILETKEQIETIKKRAEEELGAEEAEIFAAHLMMVSDPEFLGAIRNHVTEQRVNAEAAIQEVVDMYVNLFSAMDDEYMRERAADVRDVGRRILRNLMGIKDISLSELSEDVVVLAHDLTPSDTAQLNHHVLGFATEIGGRTSHSAIMARSLELPAVVGVSGLLENIKTGDLVIIDGEQGKVIVNPAEDELKAYQVRKESLRQQKEALLALVDKPSITKDGRRVELAANIGTPKDAQGALRNGAEGIGLYRTEFLYMDRQELPSEEEQYEAYRQVAEAMGDKPVIIRTLDIGGDKELPYLQLPQEANPFLGYRAIRLCLDRKDLFKIQLRAILRASVHGKLRIMYPMISGLEELRQANSLLQSVKNELKESGIPFDEEIQVGMMIEVPSAAISADLLAPEVDFFSIGTNDLIQYAVAVDRMNERISHLYQPFHPSVLRLIRHVIQAAHQHGKWVGMCGEMAGDPLAIPVLLGLGLDEFSMSASSILDARACITSISYQEAKTWAEEVLQYKTAEEIVEFLKGKLGK